jgi:predicted permease
VCGIPLGLIMTGVSLANFLDEPRHLFDAKIAGAAAALRLGVLPLALILLAKYLPCSVELKRVIIVQAAMPTAMVSVIIARLYGGHPRTAVQITLGTTALAILTIPLWIRAGLAWVGLWINPWARGCKRGAGFHSCPRRPPGRGPADSAHA